MNRREFVKGAVAVAGITALGSSCAKETATNETSSVTTSEALESHAQKRVVDLDNPPAIIPPGEIVFKTPTGKYICSVCGYVYDPAEHDGVAFEDLPADWVCPRCKQPKEKFNRA